jgi:DNA-binding PadR family transcriptional regulator
MQDHLPSLTHLQFVVLGTLIDDEKPGRFVRAALQHYGVKRSAPAFYQMMARLERDGLVEGWYGQVTTGAQAVTERRYRATPSGLKAWNQTRAFYLRVGAGAKPRVSNA